MTGSMHQIDDIGETGDPQDRAGPTSTRTVLISIIAFWVVYGIIATLRAVVMEFPVQGELAVRRLFVLAVSIFFTIGLWLVLRQFAHWSTRAQAGVIAVLAIPFAILSGAANYFFFNVYDPSSVLTAELLKLPAEFRPTALQEIAEAAISRYFFLIAWGAFYMALGFSERAAASERRTAAFARAAQTAELRALRYQVNPHFLFNTLNSLSALVMNDRREEAETMIINLSNFYRTSLAGEPVEDVPLADEVELQKLYLEIERVRFPGRLTVEIDVPEQLETVAVPGLILQPIVENAVKHGVSPLSTPVSIRIAAEQRAGDLILSVTDTGNGTGARDRAGNGIGLTNVRERLTTRFGAHASVEAGALPEGGFRVTLTLPRRAYAD